MNNYEFINVEIKDRVGIIEFNYVKKLNALSECFIQDILHALIVLNVPEIRCVILRAPKGSKVFSSGHDINELPKTKRDPLSYQDPLRILTRTIQRYPKPIISMVQGSVWGGGFELIMSTDIVIASDKSTFAMTPVNLGVPYNVVGIHNLIRDAGLHVMKEVIFTANPITAEKALKIAFDVSTKLNLQTAAFDFVINNGEPLIVEVSYGFGYPENQFELGYWDEKLTYYPGSFNPFGWIVDGVMARIDIHNT